MYDAGEMYKDETAPSELNSSSGSSPIYPQSVECNDGINRWTENKGGMTLRQHYAGLALQGLLANPDRLYDPDDAAKEAMIHADSMIYILEKNTKTTQSEQ